MPRYRHRFMSPHAFKTFILIWRMCSEPQTTSLLSRAVRPLLITSALIVAFCASTILIGNVAAADPKAPACQPKSIRSDLIIGSIADRQENPASGTGISGSDGNKIQAQIDKLTIQLKNRPKNVNALVARADAYLRIKDLDRAALDVNAAIELAPEDPAAWLALGDSVLIEKIGEKQSTRTTRQSNLVRTMFEHC